MSAARWIDRREGFWPMMFYMVLFPLLFSGAIVATVWQTPELRHLPLFLVMAVFGTLCMSLITQGLRLAPAALLAPFYSTALICASLPAWLVWGEIPGVWPYVGPAVTPPR